MTVDEKYVERFWTKVDTTGECWEWTAGTTTGGYGLYWIPGFAPSNRLSAHRAAWLIAYGALPKPGTILCHRCDNPRCVRVDHLFEGTDRTNAEDRSGKGRSRFQSRTACSYGHEYTSGNTRYDGGKRYCRSCDARRTREYKQRQKAKRGDQ